MQCLYGVISINHTINQSIILLTLAMHRTVCKHGVRKAELVDAIKNWSVGRPGNEAGCNVRITLLVLCNILYPVRCKRLDHR